MTEPREDPRERAIIDDAVSGSTDRRGRTFVAVAVALTIGFAILAAIAGFIAYSAVQDSAKEGVTLAQQVQEACADPNVDETELGSLCKNADDVVDNAPEAAQGPPGPTGPEGDPGVPGEPGPPPSSAQVQNAVALYCANGRCDGQDGQDGSDGRNVTPSQVADAVALYCNDRGECRGPEGADGAAGQDGADGERGDTGPPPSDGQVLAAVTTYCSTRDNCRGPRGEAGQDGADSTVPGPPGAEGPQGPPGTPGSVLTDGVCDFTGVGTITVTLNTSTGPVTFSCTGNPAGGGN